MKTTACKKSFGFDAYLKKNSLSGHFEQPSFVHLQTKQRKKATTLLVCIFKKNYIFMEYSIEEASYNIFFLNGWGLGN
jgi:hypothetical protein